MNDRIHRQRPSGFCIATGRGLDACAAVSDWMGVHYKESVCQPLPILGKLSISFSIVLKGLHYAYHLGPKEEGSTSL